MYAPEAYLSREADRVVLFLCTLELYVSKYNTWYIIDTYRNAHQLGWGC